MIPVLLGSTRIPDKNLLLVDGKILCAYTVDACKQSGVFSNIYLNSEAEVFSDIAREFGVQFHQRPSDFGGRNCTQCTKSRHCSGKRCVINDHYLYQFMTQGTSADYVFQVNATSPLLRADTISQFVSEMVTNNYDSFFATQEIRAESFFLDKPITHSCKFKRPSNELTPIQVVCWAIAGWSRKAFIEAYERDDIEEDGPVFVGRRGLFPIDEREALDIDSWSTLDIVENYLVARRKGVSREWHYTDGRTTGGF